MSSIFSKFRLSALLVILSLSGMNASLMACGECCDSCDGSRFYIGAFGGGIFSDSTKITQLGTVYFTEAEGGPLSVHAKGHTKNDSTGFGGVQIGYEYPIHCGCSDWTLAPAAEVEAYFYCHDKKGHLVNSVDREGSLERDFADSFHLNSSVILVNAVFSLNSPCMCRFSPYIGGGLGATRISLRDAKSIQLSPEEPGINHFNTGRSDASWAFAGQIKAGLRYNVCKSFHIFGEYRYLYVDFSNYILGSTNYPGHAQTTSWNVKIKNIQYNAFAVGIQYDL